MNDVVKSWYKQNSQEIKLIQYLLYHLKKQGHIVETKQQMKKRIAPDIKIETGIFDVEFR